MSANTRAPSTIITITLTGQTDFNVPFEYLARKFVEVTLLGVDRLPLTLNTDYRFVSKTMISLTKPYTADYSQLEIRRVTSASERLVDFHDGSILRAYDLNLSQIQTLHVAEEARDLTADTIGVNDEGHLDARNRKIVNLAYAEAGGDAIPLGQVIQWNESALASAVRAENAAFTAEAASTEAHASKDITIANAAQTAADKVTTQADAIITTNNVTMTNADVVKAEDAAIRAESASGPATVVFDRLQQVEDKATATDVKSDTALHLSQTTMTQLAEAQTKIYELESWPQRGSNDNGDWVKHRDGALECILPANTLTNIPISTAAGNLWYTNGGFKEWTFPIPFINIDIDFSFGGFITGGGSSVPSFWSAVRSPSVTGLYVGAGTKVDKANLVGFKVRATGRWK